MRLEDPGVWSHRVPTQSGVHSRPRRFTKGQARSNKSKQLERQQKAKPLRFIYIPEPQKNHIKGGTTSRHAGVAL